MGNREFNNFLHQDGNLNNKDRKSIEAELQKDFLSSMEIEEGNQNKVDEIASKNSEFYAALNAKHQEEQLRIYEDNQKNDQKEVSQLRKELNLPDPKQKDSSVLNREAQMNSKKTLREKWNEVVETMNTPINTEEEWPSVIEESDNWPDLLEEKGKK